MEMSRTMKVETVLRFADSGAILCVRRTFERPPPPQGVSQKQPMGFAHWPGGGGLCVITEERQGAWANAWKLAKPETVHGILTPYVVRCGAGEQTLANIDEEFFFAVLPPELASLASEEEQLQGLAQWVADIKKREQKEFLAQAEELRAALLKGQPPRLPHEDVEIDHHANQQRVVLELLRREWVGVAAALDGAKAAKTETEREDWRRKRFLAYLADYTTLHGTLPDVEQSEEVKLWRDEDYLRLMGEALDAPRGRVDKHDWQLAQGWMEKGYYRMSERELEAAFARDWNYSKPVKGNTLARRANRIGLLTALKKGRPENPNSLPAG